MKIDSVYRRARGPILITGETGTGKSTLASEIHRISPFSKGKFQIVNLASINESLIERELFGHLKGSFTGAFNNSNGYIDQVREGTLFLDEIGEISLSFQKKLLMLLEERIYAPIGSSSFRRFNGRVIVATNSNLKKMVREKIFREDLYYRIVTFQIRLKPIREDLELMRKLIDKFCRKYKSELNHDKFQINENCLEWLIKKYFWYGNIRELRSCIEFLVYSYNREINISDLPFWIKEEEKRTNGTSVNKNYENYFHSQYHRSIADFDKYLIKGFLNENEGKINQTSRQIGLNKTTLIAKIKKYSINMLETSRKNYNG